MFGIAEFLQDYSKDPKYRNVWQAVCRRTDSHLEISNEPKEDDVGGLNVQELTKNVGDLISGRDLRGVVAQRVSDNEVFRVSAELSSRLFLGVVYLLNDQIDAFTARASNSYWEARALAQENFEIIGRKKKIALIASLDKKVDSKTEAASSKIKELLSDDEEEMYPAEFYTEEPVELNEIEKVNNEDLAVIVRRVAEQSETPRAQSKRRYGRRQLMNTTIEVGEETPEHDVVAAPPEVLHTPRFVETAQNDDNAEQDVMQLMMERMNNTHNEVDSASVKRRRRRNRLQKEADQTTTAHAENEPLQNISLFGDNLLDFNQNALPETESPRFDQIPQAIDGVPPLHTPEGASNVPEQAEGELEAVAAEVAEDPTVKRKRTRKSRINDLLTSPIVPYVDGDIDLHSEATPVKRVRKPRKRKRQTGNEDPADISGGIFENSERVEVLRDADTGTRRSSRIQGRMSATPLLQNEAQLPEIAEDHIISPLRNPFQTSQPLLSPHLQLPEIGMLRTPSLLGAVVGVTSRSSLADFAANFSHVSSHNENALEDVETGQHEALVIRDFKKTNRATTFGQMLSSCTDRRSAMERFMGLMRLAKTKVLDVKQVAYMGTIEVDAGARFNTMMSH